MTECDKNACTDSVTGRVEFVGGTKRGYCSTHLQAVREDIGEYIAEVQLA